MAGKEYLIDTNVAIDYIGEDMPEKALYMLDGIIDRIFHISVINKIELLGFANITEDEENKIREMINASITINLDENIVNKTIYIRKQYRTKLPDAIIAATALVNKFTLISRNTKDFNKIAEIEVLNPYDM